MQIRSHADARMNQRAIMKEHIAPAMAHGEPDGDKVVLIARGARMLADELRREVRALDAVASKGGVTVVVCDDLLVTTYRTTSFCTSSRKIVRT